MKKILRLVLIYPFLAIGSDDLIFSEEVRYHIDHQLEDVHPFFDIAYNYNSHVDRDTWDHLTQYFLPENHPVKPQIDKIFNSNRRVLESVHALEKEGFKHPKIRSLSTQIIVTSHKKIPGYLFKLYVDTQKPHLGKPEWVYLVSRINGAQLIQKYIDENKLNHLFKTPKKWLYPVPQESSTAGKYRKNFILVVEEMDILNNDKNESRWKSSTLNEPLLTHFYGIVQGVGLWDCCKPANAPFTKDGRIAFIDTELYHNWPVDLSQMLKYISPQMQEYWKQLISN